MRCPKCGYISFDNVDECLKCKKNIKSASNVVKGTTFNATAPAFLNFSHFDSEEDTSDAIDLFADDIEEDDDEIVDNDLEVLLDDEEEADLSDDDEVIALEDDFDVEDEEETGDDEAEIEIDFSKFEDNELGSEDEGDEVIAEVSGDPAGQLEIDIPDELADISDLAPPSAKKQETFQLDEEEPVAVASSDEIDFDSLDFDLGLDEKDTAPADSADDSDSLLSLDDIDFSDALEEPPKKNAPKSKDMNMDDDLDFELDLGGLSIHKDV